MFYYIQANMVKIFLLKKGTKICNHVLLQIVIAATVLEQYFSNKRY